MKVSLQVLDASLYDPDVKAMSRFWCDDAEKEVERKVQQ